MFGDPEDEIEITIFCSPPPIQTNTTPTSLTVIPMESTTDDPAVPFVDAAGDSSSVSSSATMSRWKFAISQRFQHLLDKSTPYLAYRWIAFLCIAFIYAVRVYFVQGFYVVSYALGIYLLNLVVAFLSPQEDPELSNVPALPIRSSEEFRPFVRRLPEFQFWYSITKAFCIAFVLTFFSIFDVPVFWPILLFYWVMLCTVMLRRQLLHMIKYKYVPFSVGNKQRYNRKRESSPESDDAPLV